MIGLLFLRIYLALNITLLDVEIIEFACLEFKDDGLLTINHLRKIRKVNFDKNLKSLTHKISSEKNIYLHRIIDNDKIKKNYFCVELNKSAEDVKSTVNNAIHTIDENVEHVEIFYPFSFNYMQFTENGLIIKFNNNFICWKAVLNNFLEKIYIYSIDINELIDEVIKAFKDERELEDFIKHYPLIFFENNLSVFSSIMMKIKENLGFDLGSANSDAVELFKNEILALNPNEVTKKYVQLYGEEKNEEYLNFVFFLLITDVTNMLHFFFDPEYQFQIYNFNPRKRKHLAQIYICFKIHYKKYNLSKLDQLSIIGNNGVNLALRFFFDCDDYLYLMVDKRTIDYHHVKNVRIFCNEKKNFYESMILNLEKFL